LLCLESAEQLGKQSALTMRRLSELITRPVNGKGLIDRLASMPEFRPVIETVRSYAKRLILINASGETSDIHQIGQWIGDAALKHRSFPLLVVIDYLQKIPVDVISLHPGQEVTTYLAQSLKEYAMSFNVPIIAIVASDRDGLKGKRMRLENLRGSSALQYEADIGLIMSNKHKIVSRDHLVFNVVKAEKMREWVVFSIEKNRAGRHTVDLEFNLDAPHFRFITKGDFVRDRLVDEKVILE